MHRDFSLFNGNGGRGGARCESLPAHEARRLRVSARPGDPASEEEHSGRLQRGDHELARGCGKRLDAVASPPHDGAAETRHHAAGDGESSAGQHGGVVGRDQCEDDRYAKPVCSQQRGVPAVVGGDDGDEGEEGEGGGEGSEGEEEGEKWSEGEEGENEEGQEEEGGAAR